MFVQIHTLLCLQTWFDVQVSCDRYWNTFGIKIHKCTTLVRNDVKKIWEDYPTTVVYTKNVGALILFLFAILLY